MILDIDAVLALIHMGTANATTIIPKAELIAWASAARSSFVKAYLSRVALPSGRVGLVFHDPYPPKNGSRGNKVVPNHPPEMQTETAAGLVAMNVALDPILNQTLRADLGNSLAALVVDISPKQMATVKGGVIGTSHLARSLAEFGRPDAAFDLISTDGAPSYFNMASYNGVLWEHWSGADECRQAGGCTSTVGSLCHIMLGASLWVYMLVSVLLGNELNAQSSPRCVFSQD